MRCESYRECIVKEREKKLERKRRRSREREVMSKEKKFALRIKKGKKY